MTLTAEFNFNAKSKRRLSVGETEAVGVHSLSKYFCSIAVRRSLRVQQEPVIVKPVIHTAPVVIRRGMNI